MAAAVIRTRHRRTTRPRTGAPSAERLSCVVPLLRQAQEAEELTPGLGHTLLGAEPAQSIIPGAGQAARADGGMDGNRLPAGPAGQFAVAAEGFDVSSFRDNPAWASHDPRRTRATVPLR